MREFTRLVSIMKKLLAPEGCPWDRRQSHSTLLKYLREESSEFASAVRKKDYENMEEELGDILLQVVFHSALAEKSGHFSIRDVIRTLNSKLVRRHPHVFRKKGNLTERQVLIQWEKIKKREKKCKLKKNLRG